jgi:hypothetical protein
MLHALLSDAAPLLQLPIVFTHAAWLSTVQLEQSGDMENHQACRLRTVLRAAFDIHVAYPCEPYVEFEVASFNNRYQNQPLRLRLSLLLEPGQPDALLIALAREHLS